MKKFLFLLTIIFISNLIQAEEGMWMPYMLNNKNLAAMQSLGCKLTKEQIFDLNHPSLKDAIVQFGGGCTGELISPEGLLLTNHHCGIGYVQNHSSLQHDYLTDGFWAYSKHEELPNEGLKVYFLNNVSDVTAEVLSGIVESMSELERNEIINTNSKLLSEKTKDGYNVEIVPFYKGNQYIMFEYIVYEDVRLAACPPWGIGKYGADTDNWTWPRHKGDFCLFRVYTAPDGSAAKYSKDNIPLKSKHYLPISLKGVKDGDFAMILGYPGSTDRYSSSQEVKLIIEKTAPSIVKCRTTKLNVYRKHMDANKDVFIKYASKQASVSNYWKYYIGQVKQLKHNKIYEKKIALEQAFTQWISADKDRKARYGSVLADFEKEYQISNRYQQAITYHIETGLRGSEAVAQALNFNSINKMIVEKKFDKRFESLLETRKKAIEKYFADYDYALDKDASIALLNLFYSDIPEIDRPELINKIGRKNHGDFTSYINKAFEKSVFTDRARLTNWFNKPTDLSNDPIFKLMSSILNNYYYLQEQRSEAANISSKAGRLYMAALMEMQKDNINFYPDANFTMRLTYGKVAAYKPADAVTYNYLTTFDGVMQKYIPDNWEFGLPSELIELYKKKDYADYADKNGNLIVNFITTNDITGGNSGSPVIDAEGNLIGLAFDGNWEAMSGDISFEHEVQRTICVDARYIIFVIDKLGKAQNLINELTLLR